LFAEAAGFLAISPEPVRVAGDPGGMPSRLPVGDTAVACVATALAAAAGLRAQRGGPRDAVRLDAAHVVAAVRSERYLWVGGHGFGGGFAPLSRFWRAADGWVRTHANYPWHREALLRALGTAAGPDAVEADAVGSAIGRLSAETVEAAVIAEGGVAAAVRTAAQWRRHPHGRTCTDRPLIAGARAGDAPPRRRPPAALPADGLRVLDLTRVIAGPVATRYLAALGADVLRVDPPHRPELPLHRHDGLPGKRSALLDARTPEGLRRLHELLDGADVLVHGYRPGALAAFGLDPGSLADRHPGLVVVSLSAWGDSGPWADRRGFDSIVQAASGIAMAESPDGDRPGRLPCQLLDHGTGYLAAAAALEGVRRQSEAGGTRFFTLSLAATAAWLLRRTGPAATVSGSAAGRSAAVSRPEAEPQAGAYTTVLPSRTGPVTTVTPPGAIGDRALSWPGRLHGYGEDPPAW
jgi:crotonobetainyl-CoA:carnitine CoA-transferase CaiB-like acyl-CoA transferase